MHTLDEMRFGAALLATAAANLLAFFWYHEWVFGNTWDTESLTASSLKNIRRNGAWALRQLILRFTLMELACNVLFQYIVTCQLELRSSQDIMTLALGAELVSLMTRHVSYSFSRRSSIALLIDGAFCSLLAVIRAQAFLLVPF